jgi:prevent-host-death family protein
MITVNIHEAKTHFSKLIDAVMHGDEVIIAKAGKPAARLVPIAPLRPKRKPGALKGKIKIAHDFNAPLPEDLLNQFEGK